MPNEGIDRTPDFVQERLINAKTWTRYKLNQHWTMGFWNKSHHTSHGISAGGFGQRGKQDVESEGPVKWWLFRPGHS